jgi:DNA polymerase-1
LQTKNVLVGIDAEGLELRMMAHYLFPYDGGAYAEAVHSGDKSKGTDVHSVNQRVLEFNFRDPYTKNAVYAHNYGAGDDMLGFIAQDDARAAGKTLKGAPRTLGRAMRKKLATGITGLGKLIDKCKECHDKNEWIPALDGRRIQSASPHSAFNTLLQGNGSIVMKQALVLFNREVESRELDVRYCANVHDEFQVTCPLDQSKEVAELGKWSISEAGRVLKVRCPLVGSADIGNNWKETH